VGRKERVRDNGRKEVWLGGNALLNHVRPQGQEGKLIFGKGGVIAKLCNLGGGFRCEVGTAFRKREKKRNKKTASEANRYRTRGGEGGRAGGSVDLRSTSKKKKETPNRGTEGKGGGVQLVKKLQSTMKIV